MTARRTKAAVIADLWPTIAIAAAFAATLAWRAGAITPTFDEMVDSVIANCHVKTGNPFLCAADISQGRLPYLVHAFARSLFVLLPARTADLVVSGVAAVALLLALSLFARKEYGRRAGVLVALLLATSAPILAAGRMAMTHSNVIFALLTALAFIAFVRFLRDRRTETLLAAAALFGASVAANIIGASTAILFLFLFAMPLAGRSKARDMALFAAVSVTAFFACSPAHLLPRNLIGVFTSIGGIRGVSTNFDYLGLGQSVAPRWYSFLLYAVKLSPWWVPWFLASAFVASREKDAFRRHVTAALLAFIVLYLLLKGAFRYDAPHHHVHVIALGCVLVAYAADAALAAARRPATVALAACFALQAFAVAQVFPNLLFYGAQFHPRLIGEFYGPAVIQCQDQGKVRGVLRRLIDEGKDVRTMATVCWGAPGPGDLVSPWWEDRPHLPSEGGETYVFGEWVLFDHFRLTTDQRELRDRILAECARYDGSDFPFLKDVYVIYRCPADPAFDALPRLAPADQVTSAP